MLKRLKEILFGVERKPLPPVLETVTVGWVARAHFKRKEPGEQWLRDRVVWSTQFTEREYAETCFKEWSNKIDDLMNGATKYVVLSRMVRDEEDARFYLRLTPGDAYHGIRIDIHEVTEEREVKR